MKPESLLADLHPSMRGWIPGLDNAVYHGGPGIGSTMLKDFAHNPGLFDWRYLKGHPREESKSLITGSLVHLAVLEPKKFLEKYVVEPDLGDMRSSKNREKRDEWRNALAAGTVIVTQDELDMLLGMAESIMSHPTANELLKSGTAERSGYWSDPDTGLLLKCRPDLFRKGGIVIDLKTCRSTKYRIFQKDCYDFGYYLSAAHYLAGCSAIEGTPHNDFAWLAIEKTAPFTCEVFVPDEAAIERGRKEGLSALAGIAACIKSGSWPRTTAPSRRLGPINLSLPVYADYE